MAQASMQLSVQFSHSVMSDSLRPHELQHARPPCPSPTPGVLFFSIKTKCLTKREHATKFVSKAIYKSETVRHQMALPCIPEQESREKLK